ncbi:MAG: chromosomal replication initiator protein DnaA [Deltaproteobacteria bacterium]|nr:chromosomal replication initiator protein DnaA [Deltaproteobacteria bacterium]
MTEFLENQESVETIPLEGRETASELGGEPDNGISDEMRIAWDKTLQSIEKIVRPQYFQSFILTIKLLKSKDNILVLGFPDRFYRDWVYDHYSVLIQERFDEASHHLFKLEFEVETKPTIPASLMEIKAKAPSLPLEEIRPKPSLVIPPSKNLKGSLSANAVLNTKYGFETFVVGTSNQFAHAASFLVAEAPGRHYNPLFIYGDVGLGKTHLLNAIGLKILEKFPTTRVHYTTFEKFTNHMIESIRFEKMEEFRDRYRKNCDVLIIDDIQFISGKERTQEEFFHTFNALYEHHKQIVLSSDRPPKEIEGLEDRLRSRFEMGLIVDIQAPEMETRVAIIFKKAELDGIQISQDVAFFLAKIYRSNIRELEGAMLKLSAFASLTGSEINLELAKKVLKEEPVEMNQFHRDPEEIMKLVARQYQVSLEDLRSERKNRQLAIPRQLAMYLCRKYTHLSLPDIGTLFGGKNHTTVLHAIRRISKVQGTDPLLKESIAKLETSLKQVSA